MVVPEEVVPVHCAAEMIAAVVGVAYLHDVVRQAAEQRGVGEGRTELAVADGDVLPA